MIKKIIFTVLFFVTVLIQGQENIFDKYQYVIVESKFDFLKEVDQYQTSSLTKFLLQKKGFQVFLDNEQFPNEINKDRCIALFVTVIDESNMLSTKSYIQFKDCTNKVVYKSEVGKSKFKDYKRGYQDAIRKAYETMENVEYNYKPNTVVLTPKVNKPAHHPVKEATKPIIVESKTVKSPKEVKIVKVDKPLKKEVVKTVKPVSVLYAQPKNNGFQLINLKPEVVFVILKTNKSDVFIIKGKDGTLTKNGDFWIAEYYKNDALVKEKYQIKF